MKIKKVIGVTSCPVGIAHTFMSAEGLEREGKKRGIQVKIQKNAQSGIEDHLTAQDIKEADAVIICADIAVDLEPFKNKVVYQGAVKDGFKKAAKIFDDLEKGLVPVYKPSGSENPEEVTSSESATSEAVAEETSVPEASQPSAPETYPQWMFWKKGQFKEPKPYKESPKWMFWQKNKSPEVLKSAPKAGSITVEQTFHNECVAIAKKSYSQLLTGISYLLPFVVGGGILIALGLFAGIQSANINDPSYNVGAASVNAIGGAAFKLMIPVLAGYIAFSIGDRPALVPGMVGGYLANEGFANKSSGFLGAIIAGYLAGWVIVFLRKGTNKIPKSLSSIRPIIIYPVISLLVTGLFTIWAVNEAFNPLFNTETGLFTKWLTSLSNGSKAALAVVLGALICFDLGGPINKVAYLFGLAALATSQQVGEKSDIMAAVSAAAMTPPLATFFAGIIFRKRFVAGEKSAIYTNFVLGAIHITEGAIPFAAKRPWINIPIFMLGGIISSLISIFSGVKTPAPHGGFLVLPLVDFWYFWILAIFAGALVSGIIFGFATKKETEQKENIIFDHLDKKVA